MCIICTSHTSKNEAAARILPEFLMCCECGRVYSPERRELIRTHKAGKCLCGHQMIPIKEVIGDQPIHAKLLEALSDALRSHSQC